MSAVERGTCPLCNRSIGLKVPRGGDGSYLVLRPHITTEPFPNFRGVRCAGAGLRAGEEKP